MGQVLQFPAQKLGDDFYASMEAKARARLEGMTPFDRAKLCIDGLNAFAEQMLFDSVLVAGCLTDLNTSLATLTPSQQRAIIAQGTRDSATAVALLAARDRCASFELTLATAGVASA